VSKCLSLPKSFSIIPAWYLKTNFVRHTFSFSSLEMGKQTDGDQDRYKYRKENNLSSFPVSYSKICVSLIII
jgi:hypothetical protein